MPSLPYFNWYESDYLADTADLNETEDLLYRRLLGQQWLQGGTLPDDEVILARLVRFQIRKFRNSFAKVSSKFCRYEGRIYHQRLRDEYQQKLEIVEKRRKAGRASVRANASTHAPHIPDPDPDSSNNRRSRSDTQRGSRLDWQDLPEAAREFSRSLHMTDEQIADTFDVFRDHWLAQPGQRGVKRDWLATWRNWCRREKSNGRHRQVGAPRRETANERVRRANQVSAGDPGEGYL